MTAMRLNCQRVSVLTAGVLCLVAAGTACAVPGYDQINVVGFGNVETDADYIPHVVYFENGLASYEALLAQAVAARSYAFYRMETGGQINNGTIDQVYFRNNAGLPSSIHFNAAADTEGVVISFADIQVAAFYVAGAIPSGPTARPNPGDPDPTSTEQWVTYPLYDGLEGNNNIGTPLGFQGSPSNPFYRNRGAMSQNGSDFLSDNSMHYLDILRVYYGADIQAEVAVSPGIGTNSAGYGYRTLVDFDNYSDRSGNTFQGHEGTFGWSPNYSGSTTDNIAGSTAVRDSAFSFTGGHAQRIDINYDESEGGDFLLRHVSGAQLAGTSRAATQTANLLMQADGSVGFWLRTLDDGLQVSLAIDEPTTGDRGLRQDVIADGQWHRYFWDLDNNDEWEAWTGGGDGTLTDRFTLDSIQLFGNTDATVWLDEVFWDPTLNALQGDINRDGYVGIDDLDLVLANWGAAPQLTLGQGDLNADGQIDHTDLAQVLAHWSQGTPPAGVIPEPTSLALLLLGTALATSRRRGTIRR
ncbi:PEP-CTERM sorting domain-containing protein [Phycisphaeraceae bacterium D3-23]